MDGIYSIRGVLEDEGGVKGEDVLEAGCTLAEIYGYFQKDMR